MAKERFQSFDFQPATLAVIDHANTIIGEYWAQAMREETLGKAQLRALIDNWDPAVTEFLGQLLGDDDPQSDEEDEE